MNKGLFQKALPHLLAVVVFLIVAVIYCRPALEGMVVSQSDITQWKGSIHQSEEYAEKHEGQYPLWTNALFSGMPTFQIGGLGGSFVAGYAHKILTLGLPEPIQFFFLACVCFYILALTLRINPLLAIMGSLAFAYATYNPVIISAGHNTKMWSIAYMPALLGAVILIYEKKYWLGGALTALFSSTLIAMNHLQIAYYLFLVLAVMLIFYIVRFIKHKDWKHLLISGGIIIAAATMGVFSNAENLFSTYQYQKKTIRGGATVLTDTTKTVTSETGLDKGYAFSYSLKPSEPLVIMVPRMYGGSSGKEELEQEKSKAMEALSSMPRELQQQLPLTYYWGGLIETGLGTSGPPYIGAIICFLAIMAMFILDNKHKWWVLTITGLSILMSMGSYFDDFNSLLYEYLPLYNKFRAPSMILVIPQLLLPMLAVLGINKIVNTEDKKSLIPKFKKGLIATAVVFAVLLLLYSSFDFLTSGDKGVLRQVAGMDQPQLYEAVRSFFDGLKADRGTLMMNDILRSFGFILVAALFLLLLIRKTIKPVVAITGLTLFSMIDLMVINSTYLNADSYQEREENTYAFQKTAADEAILSDTSYYRVFNVGGDAFQENITSYYYNSVGGYHAAKLRIYQDLIDRQLSKRPPNMAVLNMLNTKYFVQKDGSGLTRNYQKNEEALGPVWFVEGIRYVKGADEEMVALNNFNPADTAIVQESFKTLIPFSPQPDSAASIRLVKNDNDVITYESKSAINQFAVFSEVYYDAGWKAFIDGKEAPIVKTNYVLRGLAIPAGNHTIEFRFEPSGYILGHTLTTVFSWLLLGLLIAWLGLEIKKILKSKATA